MCFHKHTDDRHRSITQVSCYLSRTLLGSLFSLGWNFNKMASVCMSWLAWVSYSELLLCVTWVVYVRPSITIIIIMTIAIVHVHAYNRHTHAICMHIMVRLLCTCVHTCTSIYMYMYGKYKELHTHVYGNMAHTKSM